MVAGEMSSFSLPPSFRRNSEKSSNNVHTSSRRPASGMKNFVAGMMSPFTACFQPDPSSCVPGCASDYHTRRYSGKGSPAVVSPLVDRMRSPPHYETPTSPIYPREKSCSRSSAPPKEDKPLPASDIEKPHSSDVLCGRGGSSNRHLGNMHFRDLVAANKKMYVGLTKKQKMLVARKIVEMVHSTEPPGRFIAKDLNTGLWYDIGVPRSLEKTSQALREKNSNEYPIEQGTEVSDVLSDVSLPASPRSDSGASSPVPADEDKPSSKSGRSGKNVEAPPLAIPPHLAEVYYPKRAWESQHPAWPEYAPSSQRLEQPYLGSYQSAPVSPRQDPYSVPPRSHHYDSPSPRSPPRYHNVQPPLFSHSEHHHYRHSPYRHPETPPLQDYREHYDYYPARSDFRNPYGQPSPHRAPPPPPRQYRGYPAPPPPGLPPRPHHGHHHHRQGSSRPPSHPRAPPSLAHPLTPTFDPQSHSHGHPHYAASPHRSSSSYASTPPSSPPPPSGRPIGMVKSFNNGYIRGKSEVSPERRQEWKRQRNEQGVPHRLNSDSSLSRAVQNSLTLEERVVGRERASVSSRSMELTSPSGALQGRSRARSTDTRSSQAAAAGTTLSEKEGDAVSALSGLAALSTAAFLKLDEND